jgi:hypothetical protein
MNTITAVALAWTLVGSTPTASSDSIWAKVDAAVAASEDGRREVLRSVEAEVRAALAEDETSVKRRYALAVVLGARANTEGGKSKVRAAAELYDQLVTILEVDPGHVGARHLLGRLHAGVRRMSRVTRWIATNLLGGGHLEGATWESAEENLAYAEARAPRVADHHLQLALVYRDTGRPELAAAEIAHVMALPAVTAMDAAVHAEAARIGADLAP